MYHARSIATRQACERLGGRSIDANYDEWVGYIKELQIPDTPRQLRLGRLYVDVI